MGQPLTVTLITGGTVARSGVNLFARIRGSDDALITQSSVSTISYVVSDLTAGTTGSSVSLTVSSAVFNSLQQSDRRWRRDSANALGNDEAHGYNFRCTVPASTFARSTLNPTLTNPIPAIHRFQVDVTFTPVSGEQFVLVYQFQAQQVYGG